VYNYPKKSYAFHTSHDIHLLQFFISQSNDLHLSKQVISFPSLLFDLYFLSYFILSVFIGFFFFLLSFFFFSIFFFVLFSLIVFLSNNLDLSKQGISLRFLLFDLYFLGYFILSVFLGTFFSSLFFFFVLRS
jgi:hypothetical protein